jgi:hypothetical protein
MSETPVRSRGRLAALGAYGFEAQELVILAALTSGDPLLLIGRSGTGKTFLLNSISEALGLEHRHYNTSLISFDDLVGFPYPDDAKASIRFLETPATESSRVSRRPHFLGGWGPWDVRVGFRRRCGSARSGWWKSIARPTPRNGRCCSPSRRSWGAGGNAPEVGAAGAA